MTISEMYDIDRILTDMEVAMQIDGKDYGEKDMDVVIRNVKTRIARQYHVDLSTCKVDDPALYVDKFRNASVLFVENITRIHAMMCGYLQCARYNTSCIVRPSNVNYLGYNDESLMTFLSLCQRKKTLPSVKESIEGLKQKLASVNATREKRLFLLLVVSYEIGFYEVAASAAEILYTGGKI